jgi:hypothetical protein
MEDKIGIGRGITGDELEKQLQEELGETNPETTEIKEEDKLEKELNNQVEVLGKKSNAVEKTYEEVGGEQGVQEVLAKMEPSQKEALSLALEEKLKSLIAERSKMNSNLADTVDGLIPGFLKADEKVTFTDIMAGMSGFVAGLAGSLAAGQGLLGKQLEDFVNNPAGGGHDFATMWTAVMGAMLVPVALRVGAAVPPIVGVTVHGIAQIPSRIANLGKTLMTKFQLRRAKKIES